MISYKTFNHEKKLLYLTLFLVTFCLTQNAQTKIWDFGGDASYTSAAQIAMWPLADFNAPEGATVKKDALFLVGDSSGDKYGKIENAGGKTWDAGTENEYTSINRFKTEGGSNPEDNNLNPTHSYMYFPLSGPVSIKIWYRSGGSSERSLFISDETSVLNSVTKVSDTDPYTITADYNGTGENISIYSSNSFSLYKIEVSGSGASTLSVNPVENLVKTKLRANNNRIYVTDVASRTQIKIYNVTGSLVKSINTATITDFCLKKGLWIAQIKTDKGQKTIKLLSH